MKLNIEIQTGENCGFNVLDITCGDSGYLPESSEVPEVGRFKYSDTLGIIVMTLNKVDSKESNPPIYILHEVGPQYTFIPTEFDGWFTLNYIVLPTKEWFDNSQEELEVYDTVYYSDGNKVYKYFNLESTEVDVAEVIERNEDGTTISKIVNEFVSICFLKKCFINLCKQIFDSRGFSKCLTKGNIDSTLLYNRDLIWMTINTISYLAEFGQLAEAERLIEQIENDCNGICKSYNRGSSRNGCGCP